MTRWPSRSPSLLAPVVGYLIKIFESNLGNPSPTIWLWWCLMCDKIKGPQCTRPREKRKSKSSGTVIFFGPPPGFEPGYLRSTCTLSYDHTTVKAPHPIRTAKLSTVGPDQYYGRGLRGNLGCCMAFWFLGHHLDSNPGICCRQAYRHTIIPRWKHRIPSELRS